MHTFNSFFEYENYRLFVCISKTDLFAVQTGYLTGQRQYYEDQLELATTKEEIEAIIPEYKYYEVGKVDVEA